jgi:repressor LexA
MLNVGAIGRNKTDEIRRHTDAKGYPPTVKELSETFGISHSTVHQRTRRRVRKGFLQRKGCKARGLTAGDRPEDVPTALVPAPVPRPVAAAHPILVHERIVPDVFVEASTVSTREHLAPPASGDRLIRPTINDGHRILVRRRPLADTGDIVVVPSNDHPTAKRLTIAYACIGLVPENPRLAPITHPPEDIPHLFINVVVRNDK